MTKEEYKYIRTDILDETQTAFADRLGYSCFVIVSRKENGKLAITKRDAKLLAAFIPQLPTKEHELTQ